MRVGADIAAIVGYSVRPDAADECGVTKLALWEPTTRRQAGAGSHPRARSSAPPPVPRSDCNLVINGLQTSRGFGGSAPILPSRSRRPIGLSITLLARCLPGRCDAKHH